MGFATVKAVAQMGTVPVYVDESAPTDVIRTVDLSKLAEPTAENSFAIPVVQPLAGWAAEMEKETRPDTDPRVLAKKAMAAAHVATAEKDRVAAIPTGFEDYPDAGKPGSLIDSFDAALEATARPTVPLSQPGTPGTPGTPDTGGRWADGYYRYNMTSAPDALYGKVLTLVIQNLMGGTEPGKVEGERVIKSKKKINGAEAYLVQENAPELSFDDDDVPASFYEGKA